MGWLPSVYVLVAGVVLLVVLAVVLIRPVRRAQGAARALGIAVAGRTVRVRAGVAEMNAWRAARRAAGGSGGDA